ncbi:MAG: cbb3-type cytochrome c oxidase subunit I [Rhodocyclales bacterium]|nr:cbb3-type cytochrome c oxidase subunit I [Rhodocyclales bacterium]
MSRHLLGNFWNRLVMDRRNWWLPLSAVLFIGLGSMIYVGTRTYQDAPPIPDFVAESGETLLPAAAITRGQIVFLKYGLMNYGSMFGDGAGRGPDFTADALHAMARAMRDHHASRDGVDVATAVARTQAEIRNNRHVAADNRVTLGEAQAYAVRELERRYAAMFRGEGEEPFHPAGYITDAAELRDLAAFFFWGGWVCGAARPGEDYSYTHNWPYDELAGNRPSAPIMMWSVAAALGLIIALGVVLFLHGRYGSLAGWRQAGAASGLATRSRVDGFAPTALQRATYKFFAAATLLFLLQVVAGVLTLDDFLRVGRGLGIDLAAALPITIVRAWHLQLALMWISACWVGASVFVLSAAQRETPPGLQRELNLLFGVFVVWVAGTLIGIAFGSKGLLGEYWNLLGNQGWEFVEMGKLWQGVLFVVFALWLRIVARLARAVWHEGDAWTLPKWLLYAVASVLLLFVSGFVARPETNFVVADFWRWAVIHMWVEAFFEVFTTALLAYFMVLMGFVSHAAASRIVYLATLLFLGSGLLGISHNFYWNAKPVATLALGSIFSTLQVVPLILLTLEAWQFRNAPHQALGGRGAGQPAFGQAEAFLFLIGVNFWNFFGAGVFGFIINLPIVNYYEHSTYLTVNHGHAALMGVYGNLAIAAIIFCSRYLIAAEHWDARLLRHVFWALNLGLLLMVVIDLFPAGIAQLNEVLAHGLWQARSQAFIEGELFRSLTWARIVGGTVFIFGGVLPLVWFVTTRLASLKPAQAPAPSGATEDLAAAAAPAR